jgi:hypothetical protein
LTLIWDDLYAQDKVIPEWTNMGVKVGTDLHVRRQDGGYLLTGKVEKMFYGNFFFIETVWYPFNGTSFSFVYPEGTPVRKPGRAGSIVNSYHNLHDCTYYYELEYGGGEQQTIALSDQDDGVQLQKKFGDLQKAVTKAASYLSNNRKPKRARG